MPVARLALIWQHVVCTAQRHVACTAVRASQALLATNLSRKVGAVSQAKDVVGHSAAHSVALARQESSV